MNNAALKKILCLVLILCHGYSEAQPIRFYNRTANITAQLGMGNQTNGTQHNMTSPDTAASVTSRSWLVPTIVASVVLLGVCIYAYCKHRRNQMVVYPLDDEWDDHDDGGEDDGGGGGHGVVHIPQFEGLIPSLNSLPHDHPERIFEASSFAELPRALQNELRSLRQLPINSAGELMSPAHTDERDFALFFNTLENYPRFREIIMFDARDRRIFLGHRTDVYEIFIRHIDGEISPEHYLPLNERRVNLVSMRFINDVFERTSIRLGIRLGIPNNERALETYILAQRSLASLPDDIVGNINELAFAGADFGLLTLLGRWEFSIAQFHRIFNSNGHPIDYSRFRFFR
jgi:hypothetical protein